jgi:hypothetical protein
MSYCSYCNYLAPTNSRYQRHINTNKHARNFMLHDAGIQDLSQPDEPPKNEDDIPDLVCTNDDDDDLPDLDSIQIVDFPSDTDSTSGDDLPEVVDVSTSTFDFEFKYVPIDDSTRELANTSFDFISSISQFFTDHSFVLYVIGIVGFILYNPQPTKPP